MMNVWPSRRWWPIAALAVFFAAAAVWRWRAEPRAAEVRVIEPRLSGLAWAPLVSVEEGRTRVAAASALVRNADPQSSAKVSLRLGEASRAIAVLSATPEDRRDAATWNDLAAAHIVAGDLKSALVAVDAALRIDRRRAEARFNRALILERYQIRDLAADAWNEALSVEADANWAAEARRHRDALARPLPNFNSEVERQYARLERGERAVADALVRLDPGDARYFGEKDALGRWGEAWLRGDRAAADRHLTAARTLGAAITRDSMVADAVAAIDRAKDAAREKLARGHVAFREGRRLYREARKPIEAEKQLVAAARDLESGGSPMALEARVFVSVAITGQTRFTDAEPILEELDASVPARYPALRGYVQWQLATCSMARAQWGRTNALLLDAISAYERLGEANNAAYLHDILSQCFGIVGDRERAAQHRVLALRKLGEVTNYRLGHVLSGMVYDATQARDWRAALSFLDVEIEINRRVGDPELLLMAFSNRTLVHARLGETAAADADLREASAVLAGVEDAALRRKLTADHDAVAALVAARPEEAIRLLTEALRFHETAGWQSLAPGLYLRRGRMYLQLGDRDRAAADFESGIATLEQHRQSLPVGEARWGILDAADELFEEAIEGALRRGDVAAAFAYAERERARSIADTLPKRAVDVSGLAADVGIIEYAVLPQTLITFTVDRTGYRMIETPIAREALSSIVERFSLAVQDGRRDAAAYDVLIAPVREFVSAHRELIFVPDAVTALVPFAALSVADAPLIETHTVAVAPSTRFAVQARATSSRRESLLIVDNPATENMPSLSAAKAEANSIEREYAATHRLTGRAATTSAFLDEARNADVIHFAGHGVAGADSAALLLASGPADAATLSRARLTRTEVVVLAACESARGPVRSAEGVLSVAHAFLQAGAPSVIATLRDIPDEEAADFFPHLHRHLARGIVPAEALRLAQLEFRSRNPRSSLWAAVEVIGH